MGGFFMRQNNRQTGKLRLKIGICIVIVIAVLIVKKIGGYEDNKLISAVAEYYGRDYSVEDVADAMSQGIEKAGRIPDIVSGVDEND